MTRRSDRTIARPDAHADERSRNTPWMAIALVAGIVAGAKLAQSWYREAKRHARAQERRERLQTWEGEGGALPGTIGTGSAANPPPRH